MMSDLLRFVTLALATFYVAVTMARLHGPFGLAFTVREWLHRWRRRRLIRGDELAFVDFSAIEDDWMVAGLDCPVCMAPYALALVLLLEAAPIVGALALPFLGVCGAAALLWYVVDRD